MLGLPKSTEFNRRIPKQKFYENFTISPTLQMKMRRESHLSKQVQLNTELKN